LIEWPWLALVPATLLLAIARIRCSRFAGTIGILWVMYSLYELGMRARILCSGDCNIRLDLVVIYPVLAVLSLAAVVVAVIRVRNVPSA